MASRVSKGLSLSLSHVGIESCLNAIDHFEADVLSFFVTVQPEHHHVRPASLLLEKGRHAVVGRGFLLQRFTGEQFSLEERRRSTAAADRERLSLTGSTLSQLLKRGTKSIPKTCPATEVIRKRAEAFDWKRPVHSWTLQTLLKPFLEDNCPLERI